MESEFQRLLDEQWDALESRDRRIHTIRREIASKLNLLAESRAKDASELGLQLTVDRDYMQKQTTIAAKRKTLEAQLAAELESDLHQSIASLTGQIGSLDEKIKQLQIKRFKLSQEIDDLKSIFSSRTAKIYDFLADLEASHPVVNQEMIEVVEKGVNDREIQQSEYTREALAAKQGFELWNQVCAQLNELDSELKGLKRDQLPQMAFLLDQAASKVHESLDFAADNGWPMLEIAIGHEIQILEETKAAVRKAA